jgi:hypothetical protein
MPIPSGYTSGQVVQAVPSLSAYAVTSSTRPASPFDGQIISETDTDTLKVYNGTSWIGVGGLVPMVPTSVAVGSGTGTANALGQVTFSGASSVSLNGVFTSAYRNYKMVCQYTVSVGQDTRLRLRAGGSDDSTASSYVVQSTISTNASAAGDDATNTSAAINFNAATTLTNVVNQEFFNPQIAVATVIIGSAMNNTNGGYFTVSGGTHNQTVSYDGFTLFGSSGNMTGTVSVYGYNQ